jgi:hypothetical protein
MAREDLLKVCGMTIACILLSTSGSPAAETNMFVCSGKLRSVQTDPSGTSWLDVGHGIYQCSIRDVSSANANKILSICNLNADCSLKATVDMQRQQKSAAKGECDGLCIFESDKIIWVKKGSTKK